MVSVWEGTNERTDEGMNKEIRKALFWHLLAVDIDTRARARERERDSQEWTLGDC